MGTLVKPESIRRRKRKQLWYHGPGVQTEAVARAKLIWTVRRARSRARTPSKGRWNSGFGAGASRNRMPGFSANRKGVLRRAEMLLISHTDALQTGRRSSSA